MRRGLLFVYVVFAGAEALICLLPKPLVGSCLCAEASPIAIPLSQATS